MVGQKVMVCGNMTKANPIRRTDNFCLSGKLSEIVPTVFGLLLLT